MQSENIGELAAALAKAQGEMKNAVKDTANPFFKSRYADLASVYAACREALSSNGLSVVQPTKITESGDTVIVTTLMHASGQWISGEYKVKPLKDDSQALGSAMTYARRYALAAMIGVAQDDDDGEAAGKAAKKPVVDTTSYAQAIEAAKSKAELETVGKQIQVNVPEGQERALLGTKFSAKMKTLTS